jgi:hypothetical protein
MCGLFLGSKSSDHSAPWGSLALDVVQSGAVGLLFEWYHSLDTQTTTRRTSDSTFRSRAPSYIDEYIKPLGSPLPSLYACVRALQKLKKKDDMRASF